MTISTLLRFRATLILEGLDTFSGEHFRELTARTVDAARKLQRLEIADCNRVLTDGERFMLDHLRTALQVYCKSLGIERVTFDGDSRGHVVKVHLPSGRSNHWGGGTWAVLG